MTTPTPCRGQGAVYDLVLNPTIATAERREARLTASALCGTCPIAGTCPDRITPPAAQPRPRPSRTREAHPMPDSQPVVPRPAPKLAPSPGPTTEQPLTAEALIAWGAAHPMARVQAMSTRARAVLADLKDAHGRQAAVAAAEARIARLKAQIANAEEDLRRAKGTKAAGAPAAPAQSAVDYAAVRAWAREHGVEVGAVGRPARAVIEAYHSAQQSNAIAS